MYISPRVITGAASAPINGISGTTGAAGSSFADAIGGAINAVESQQQSAKSAAMDLLTAGKGDVANVALATQKAQLSLDLFQQVRNKFVSAYQEIMKMPM
jgi:flagellar hook-basal body complex protein FliE